MTNDEEEIKQIANGKDNTQVINKGNHNFIQIIKEVIASPPNHQIKAILVVVFILQWFTFFSFIYVIRGLHTTTWLPTCCPIIFGIPSLYGLVLGFLSKDRKLLLLSTITGISTFLPILTMLP